jgi:transcription elongation factor
MTAFSRSIAFAALACVLGTAGAVAQSSESSNGSASAMTPSYPRGNAGPQVTVPQGTSRADRAMNPNVRGATGDHVVKGDRSTIRGDGKATTEQRTGEGTGDN